MKKQVSTLFAGILIGFITAQMAKTLIYGLIVLGAIAAVVWAILSVQRWRDKIEALWSNKA